jgi:hypothetical protein
LLEQLFFSSPLPEESLLSLDLILSVFFFFPHRKRAAAVIHFNPQKKMLQHVTDKCLSYETGTTAFAAVPFALSSGVLHVVSGSFILISG